MAEKKKVDNKVEEPAVVTTGEEMVKIRLPKDRNSNEDAVVWVNERRFLIKRGIEVEVPASVAEILENKERMLDYMYDYEQKKQSK